jgi:hypothetical protein
MRKLRGKGLLREPHNRALSAHYKLFRVGLWDVECQPSAFAALPLIGSKPLTPDFCRRAGHGEITFDETGRVCVQWAGETRLLAADGYLELAWFDYCSAVICITVS